MVIISLLLFMHTLSLFAFTTLHHSQLNLKAVVQLERRDRLSHWGELALRSLEQRLFTGLPKHCFVERKFDEHYHRQSHDWWHQHACHVTLDNMTLGFLVEPLGQVACVTYTSQNGINTGVDYYRITLRAGLSSPVHVDMQSVVAVASAEPMLCEGPLLHQANLGRQAKRVLW